METPPIDIMNPVAVAEAVRKNGGKPVTVQIYLMNGIFGELPNCNGVAEEVIDTDEKLLKYGLDPAEGGTFIKLIGCSFLYKGNPDERSVFGMEQAKSNTSTLVRDIVGRSWLYSGAVVLRAIFRRKNFINDIHVFFNEIKHKTMRHCSPPEIRLSQFTREIRRAMDVALKKEFKIDPAFNLFESGTSFRGTDIDFAGAISKMVSWGTLIMERDGAYRFPTQDMFGEVDKENATRSGAREMIRLVNLMIERNINLTIVPGISDRTEGVPNKFKFIKRIMQVAFFFSPRARRIAQTFLLELEISKVGLDDADWYFCLRRNTHNYRGIPLPDRLRELEAVDKLKGNFYVKIEINPPTAEQPNAKVILSAPKVD
jgi:hypothetical protein